MKFWICLKEAGSGLWLCFCSERERERVMKRERYGERGPAVGVGPIRLCFDKCWIQLSTDSRSSFFGQNAVGCINTRQSLHDYINRLVGDLRSKIKASDFFILQPGIQVSFHARRLIFRTELNSKQKKFMDQSQRVWIQLMATEMFRTWNPIKK